MADQGCRRSLDLGDTALLPGLVNAHCHLDYTGMAGQFPPPKVFTDWLKQITATKAGWSLGDYRDSWRAGAEMLVRTGTTTVGDVEAVPELLPWAWRVTPLRVVSFLELIHISGRRAPEEVLGATLKKLRLLAGASPRSSAHLSPHAPYTTLPALLGMIAHWSQARRHRLCTHVAESAFEFEMFTRRRGEMFDWMRRSGRDNSDCGLGSPIRHLARCGVLGENLLAIHANYLARGDARLLAKNRVSVVHCPRSHHYFRHDPFPLRRLMRAGVNVCLGTDSLVSVCRTGRQPPQLSMFAEMRAMAQAHPDLRPVAIVQMATRKAARGLGMADEIGQLVPGARADLVAIPVADRSKDVYANIVHHDADVTASLIGGRWVIPPRAVNSGR